MGWNRDMTCRSAFNTNEMAIQLLKETETPQKYNRNTIELPQKYYRSTIEILQKYHRNTIELPQKCYRSTQKCNANTICNGDAQDLEETASVGRGSPVQQELEDSETEASTYIVTFSINLVFS